MIVEGLQLRVCLEGSLGIIRIGLGWVLPPTLQQSALMVILRAKIFCGYYPSTQHMQVVVHQNPGSQMGDYGKHVPLNFPSYIYRSPKQFPRRSFRSTRM